MAHEHTALAMSEAAESSARTPREEMDRALSAVAAKKQEFARLPLREKIALLQACLPALKASVPAWIREACRAKGIEESSPTAGEEWLAGPYLVMRNLRLLVESLEAIARAGSPPFGTGVHTRPDGRVVVDVFPANLLDKLLYSGFTGHVVLQEGISEARGRELQASFYKRKQPAGGLTLTLGAGNVSSIGPMDALYKLFVDGQVGVLKMNPVNEYLGPVFEQAFAPLIAKDYLRVLYGGAEVGAYLCQHPLVDDIHITGSDRTHDLIVWGPPGPERDRRKAANDPLLKKEISSELGNVSPVMVVPGRFSPKELAFTARNVASQVTNNASFNCNAAKMLVLSRGWAQKDELVRLVKENLAKVAPRKAYYPGAQDRYRTLTQGKEAETIGAASEGQLAWTVITGLDAKANEPQFTTEPFCAVLSVVELEPAEPVAFLQAATAFANDRLWGTLNAAILVEPRTERRPEVGTALDQAVMALRYGTVAINHWPALGYGFVTTPWGGHPSATLANIQSGRGWVHNTFMLEGIEKGVVRGPLTVFPKPPWFFDNARTPQIAAKLIDLEMRPSLFRLPAVIAQALKG